MILSKVIVVKNPSGLQMRSAAQLVKVASRYKSDLWVWKEETKVNGKSLLSLLSLGASAGSHLEFVVDGDDADSLLEDIFGFFNTGIEPAIPTSFEPLAF